MAHIGNYRRATYCEHCCVTIINQGDRYCEPCADELIAWLYLAEQQQQDEAEEQEYLAAMEEKHSNLYYES